MFLTVLYALCVPEDGRSTFPETSVNLLPDMSLMGDSLLHRGMAGKQLRATQILIRS
jgi:hypothetical protein